MRSLLHQLENNETILLMYLAGELPAQDRTDVEQMLSRDPGMRAELERLRETVGQVESALAELDKVERLPMTADVAARRVGRMVSQWNADRLAAESAAAAARAARPHRVSKWAYPAAAVAACALISWGIWWAANSGGDGLMGPPVAVAPQTSPATEEALPDIQVADVDPAEDPSEATVAAANANRRGAWRERLDALENDVYALSSSSDGSPDGVETQ